MRRALPAVAAALLTATGFGIALALPGHDADASVVVPPAAAFEQRYGIVRYDTGAGRWAVLSTRTFQPSGLTGVSCSSSGKLTVRFTPLTTIGTFTVDEDEAYAGRYAAGASVTSSSMTIVIRKQSTGATVSCNARELRIADSNLQVWIAGTVAPISSPTPTFSPGGPTSALPTKPPTVPTPGQTTQPSSDPIPSGSGDDTAIPPTEPPIVIPDE